jgi:Domain of unknown function (DUF1877).
MQYPDWCFEMDVLAYYIMVSDEEVDDMMEMDDEELVEYVDELESERKDVFCLDMLWDGLHFLITGKSIEDIDDDDNIMSMAIAGVHTFDTDDEIFVGCTENGELEDVIKAMESVDIDALCNKADLSKFRKNDIYPDIWSDNNRNALMKDLKKGFDRLLEFYRSALKKGLNIIVDI